MQASLSGPAPPAMTDRLIHDVWVSADLTENNLGNTFGQGTRSPSCLTACLTAVQGESPQRRLRGGRWQGTSLQVPLPTVRTTTATGWAPGPAFPGQVAFQSDDFPLVEALRVGGQADVLV